MNSRRPSPRRAMRSLFALVAVAIIALRSCDAAAAAKAADPASWTGSADAANVDADAAAPQAESTESVPQTAEATDVAEEVDDDNEDDEDDEDDDDEDGESSHVEMRTRAYYDDEYGNEGSQPNKQEHEFTVEEVDGIIADMISWINSNGGRIHPSITPLRVIPGDPYSPHILVTTGPISNGEILFRMPYDIVVMLIPTNRHDVCETVSYMYHELNNTHGKQTPFGRYLQTVRRNQLPSMWTEAGQNLLEQILGDNLAPLHFDDYMNRKLYTQCEKVLLREDEEYYIDWDLYEHAWMLVESRANNHLVIPFFDFFQHSNNDYNAHDFVNKEAFAVVSEGHINRPNTTLSTSFNACNLCGNKHQWFGTPEIFQSHGFVENYPRNFILSDWGRDTYRLKFSVDRTTYDANDPSRKVVASFDAPLSKEAIAFVEKELEELKIIGERKITTDASDWPGILPFEWDTAWRLHEAYVEAFTAASQHREMVTDIIWEKNAQDWTSVENWNREYAHLFAAHREENARGGGTSAWYLNRRFVDVSRFQPYRNDE